MNWSVKRKKKDAGKIVELSSFYFLKLLPYAFGLGKQINVNLIPKRFISPKRNEDEVSL